MSDARLLDVKLGGDWLDFWLPKLDELQLKIYLEVAHFTNSKTYHSMSEFTKIFPERTKTQIRQTLRTLEGLGLIEVVRKDGMHHYHLLHVDDDNFHRARVCKPSVHEALKELEQMLGELEEVSRADDTEALRQRIFAKYPALQEEWKLHQRGPRENKPGWRLWMELAIHLQNHFDQNYGKLREMHSEIFKDISAKFVQLNLSLVDQITTDILTHRPEYFRYVSDTWVATETEAVFVQKENVRALADKYQVGSEMIFLNLLEALEDEGTTVLELDAKGRVKHLLLPSTTGLDEGDERMLFLRPDEFNAEEMDDLEETYQRIRRVQESYVEHLVGSGVLTLVEADSMGLIADIEPLLKVLKGSVNDALELVTCESAPQAMRPRPVSLKRVQSVYNSCRSQSV